MPSANAPSMPLNPLDLKPASPDSIWQILVRFVRRLVRSDRWHAPALPGDLERDVGLGESLPLERTQAYWNDRPRSRLKDLPF